MTSKRLGELQIGDFVADMHYGFTPLRERFHVEEIAKWHHPFDQCPFAGFQSRMNKGLYVLGVDHYRPAIICGYTYDGDRSGIVRLEEK